MKTSSKGAAGGGGGGGGSMEDVRKPSNTLFKVSISPLYLDSAEERT